MNWTEEKKAEFRRLYSDERRSMECIAEHFGIKINSANLTRSRLGIPARSRAGSKSLPNLYKANNAKINKRLEKARALRKFLSRV